MSENMTIARPYAKAIFQLALESNCLKKWSLALNYMVEVLSTNELKNIIAGPVLTSEMQANLISSVVLPLVSADLHDSVKSLVILLANNKRLGLIDAIAYEFEDMRATQEKTMSVDIQLVTPLDKNQEEQLIKRLEKRFDRKVTLNIIVDPSLLGGMIIRAGDFVIDDSVRLKIKKLGAYLAA